MEEYLYHFFEESFEPLKPKFKNLNTDMLQDQMTKEIFDNWKQLFSHMSKNVDHLNKWLIH